MLHKIFTASIGLLILSISVCFAKNINLYEQPKADAKIIGTIDPAKGIVPIFTPKDNGWIKIGNPHDGNVGWVKSSDLHDAASVADGFSFTQHIVNSGKGPQSYVLQFGVPQQLTQEQSEALFKQIQAQQEVIQKNVQQMMQNFYTHFGSDWMNYPIIMPVVVMPQSTTPAKQPNTPIMGTTSTPQ